MNVFIRTCIVPGFSPFEAQKMLKANNNKGITIEDEITLPNNQKVKRIIELFLDGPQGCPPEDMYPCLGVFIPEMHAFEGFAPDAGYDPITETSKWHIN